MVLSFDVQSNEMATIDEVQGGSFHEFVVQINDYCTATFIAPTVMVTADHCLGRTRKKNRDVLDLLVYRGRVSEGDFEDQYVIFDSKKLESSEGDNRYRDLALVTVYPPLSANPEEFPQIASREKDEVVHQEIIISGYPASANSQLKEGEGFASYAMGDKTGTRVNYFIQTAPGVSGAAIRLKENSRDIVGIHRGAFGKNAALNQYKDGILFTEDEVHEINQYLDLEEARDWSRQIEVLKNAGEPTETYLRTGYCETIDYCDVVADGNRSPENLIPIDEYPTSDSEDTSSSSSAE